MIPPRASAAFVAQMEAVLALYAEPYDAARPVVCLDERPCLVHADVREGLPVRPGAPARVDHEYERRGSCCATVAFEPLRAWRRAWVRPRRTRVDFAELVRELCDESYPGAERIRLVCDNLNTHGVASLYEAFEPAEARRLADRIEFVHTPVHGSWLNVVEVELSILSRQCLNRRLGNVEAVRREVTAWALGRNAIGGTVRWQLGLEEARRKLARLYPSV